MWSQIKTKEAQLKKPVSEITKPCLSHTRTKLSPTFERPGLSGRESRTPGRAVHAHWCTQGGGGGGGVTGGRGMAGGRKQQVTHESPPHNSQLVTLKLRVPPTLAWQEFERGYEQKRWKKTTTTTQQFFSWTFTSHVIHKAPKQRSKFTNQTFSFPRRWTWTHTHNIDNRREAAVIKCTSVFVTLLVEAL